jgi:CheY-like chemotaxis protein
MSDGIPTPGLVDWIHEDVASPIMAPLLIVDDRVEDLMALETLLAVPHYQIVKATSGAEALRVLLKMDFAVILLDARMPEMDGFEVASLIKRRERSRHTPLLFLTAAGPDVEFIHRAYSVGAVDYLTKPIDAGLLRAKVAVFADLFRKDAQIRAQARSGIRAHRRCR